MQLHSGRYAPQTYPGRWTMLFFIVAMAASYAFQVMYWKRNPDVRRNVGFATFAAVTFIVVGLLVIYSHWPN
jgi:hypothetical protein